MESYNEVNGGGINHFYDNFGRYITENSDDKKFKSHQIYRYDGNPYDPKFKLTDKYKDDAEIADWEEIAPAETIPAALAIAKSGRRRNRIGKLFSDKGYNVMVEDEYVPVPATGPAGVDFAPAITRKELEYLVKNSMKQDLNVDKNMKKIVVSDIRKKFLDSWLQDEYPEILGFVQYKDGRASLISDMSQYALPERNEPLLVTRKKIEYLKEHFITYENVKDCLKKFVKHHDIKWYKLPKHKSSVMRSLAKWFKELLDYTVSRKKI